MRPVVLDGLLAIIVGCCGFAISALSTDESFKYVTPPQFRFWLIFGFGFINAGAVSLMFFRNKSMSEHTAGQNRTLQTTPQSVVSTTETQKQP